jgi:hypothetical protein
LFYFRSIKGTEREDLVWIEKRYVRELRSISRSRP